MTARSYQLFQIVPLIKRIGDDDEPKPGDKNIAFDNDRVAMERIVWSLERFLPCEVKLGCSPMPV